jgi:hypothetical protein
MQRRGFWMKTDLGYFFNDAGIEEERTYFLRNPDSVLIIRMRHGGDNQLYGELSCEHAAAPDAGRKNTGVVQHIRKELHSARCREIVPGTWRIKNYEFLLSLFDQIKGGLKPAEMKLSSRSREHFAEILSYHPDELNRQSYYIELDGNMISSSKNVFLVHLYPYGKGKLQIFCRCEIKRKNSSLTDESDNIYSWILSSSQVKIIKKDDLTFVLTDAADYRKVLEKLRMHLTAIRYLYTEIKFTDKK